ncbi:MAG: CDP-diacylglycerol--glycerol-3-phosphate 3-phosphatidyltransferase [Bacilli bacterium]|nr:CDP-diacylglycerol--glycerol-3-phosphate 3-phosphatidyltransferase [Bacilli bacterium]
MNLPTKLTIVRIFLAIVLMLLLIFPFDLIGVEIPVVRSVIDMDLRYIIAGGIFIVASLTDFLDGYLARRYDMVTDLGKMLDSIADKILVNPVLIIFSAEGLIHPLVPVIIITRDIVVNAIKMEASIKGRVVAAISSGKIKTATMLLGMTLLFFSNMPFEYLGVRVDLFFIYFATIMSLVSMVQYYSINRKILFTD